MHMGTNILKFKMIGSKDMRELKSVAAQEVQILAEAQIRVVVPFKEFSAYRVKRLQGSWERPTYKVRELLEAKELAWKQVIAYEIADDNAAEEVSK